MCEHPPGTLAIHKAAQSLWVEERSCGTDMNKMTRILKAPTLGNKHVKDRTQR